MPLATLLLTSCTWIGNTADRWGEHLPVVDDRCEHWQCITPSGQAISDANKQKMGMTVSPPKPPETVAPPAAYPAQPEH